jgi:predicted lysophospholipase L1 biosynthesis ABC-type transport system permease subunit
MSDGQPGEQLSTASSSRLSAEMMAALAALTGLVGSFVYAVVFAPIAILLGYLATQKPTSKRWPTWVGWATIVISTLNFVAWLLIFVPTLL